MRVVHRRKYKGPFSIDHWERRSHARSLYATQYTSRMGTARVKHEEETDSRISQGSSKKSERKERGHEGEKSQTRPA